MILQLSSVAPGGIELEKWCKTTAHANNDIRNKTSFNRPMQRQWEIAEF